MSDRGPLLDGLLVLGPHQGFFDSHRKYWRRLEHSRISPLVNRFTLKHLFVFGATNPKLILVRLKIMLTTHV